MFVNSNYYETEKKKKIILHENYDLIHQRRLFFRETPRISEDRFTCIFSSYSAKIQFLRRNYPTCYGHFHSKIFSEYRDIYDFTPSKKACNLGV